MSPRSWKERIEDILDAIAEIQTFTQSMNFDLFRDDPRTLKAVALNFVVIGEAAARVPDAIADGHPEVAWSLMRGMRNRLVHDYFSIDAEIVWDTLQNDLPPLVVPLKRLLETA
jgi:uncharacterized protein with HEPN domain